ncbi:class E sortase [Streptomyces sp. NPDC058961]|uniref:class E sortase n=1 Tax=Streptomyces sp. NPDC058961 TaxID=3346680 RepID=UPI0036ACD19A
MRGRGGRRALGGARAGGGQGRGVTSARPEHEYDPLTDPLPQGGHESPWFRSDNPAPEASAPVQEPASGPVYPPGPMGAPEPVAAPQEWYEPVPPAYQQDWYPAHEPMPEPMSGPVTTADPSATAPIPAPIPAPISEPISVAEPTAAGDSTADPASTRAMPAVVVPPATGGRAERRKAAKGKGRAAPAPAPAAAPATGPDGRRLTRAEARRAAKARKDSPAVIASRVLGEAFITLGVVMLLFVTYQLWWTNVRAHQEAGSATKKITQDWADGRKPGTFAPGQGFAIMHIPKLDIVAPVAQGTSKAKVLDKGMIGHYDEGGLKTAMPSDPTGNFAVAAHRNTHGEPFRYINRLKAGDKVVVETQEAYYTYEITSELPQTPPSNVSVLKPIPVGSGFTKPGRYLTLTTCTPEFTSTYRLIVWGKMVDDRPRSKGKPDALVG